MRCRRDLTEINLIIGETAGTGVKLLGRPRRPARRRGAERRDGEPPSGVPGRSATPSAGSACGTGRRESPCGCRSTPRWSSPRQASRTGRAGRQQGRRPASAGQTPVNPSRRRRRRRPAGGGEGSAERTQRRGRRPAGALGRSTAGIATGARRWTRSTRTGIPQESTASTAGDSDTDAAACNRSAGYANPVPGVWEFELEAAGPLRAWPTPSRHGGRQGVTVEPSTVEPRRWRRGWHSRRVDGQTVRSDTVRLQGGAWARRTDGPAIAEFEQLVYEVVVPAAPPASTWRSATRVI